MSGSKGCSGGAYRIDDLRKLPKEYKPNSRLDLYRNGELYQSRWYDHNGRAIKNRDYTNHNNPKQHPIVPHDHLWVNGKRESSGTMPDLGREKKNE